MSRLSAPKLFYLEPSDTFHFQNRELPVFDSCDGDTFQYYCISHKLFFDTEEEYEDHIEHASTHELVIYCKKHEKFENV